MQTIIYGNAVIWIGPTQEVLHEIQRLAEKYPRLIDLIHTHLH